jgi:hypothetical protein
MVAYQRFNAFVENLAEGVHNLETNALKIMLTLTAPVNTNSVKADLTEIAAGNGYTAGGIPITSVTSAQTAGTYKLATSMTDPVWTATGAMAAFRYVALWNDTPTSPADPLIGFWDYGSTVNLAATETFTVDFDPTNGILQITSP